MYRAGEQTTVVGVPAELKPSERRVALTPEGVGELTARGHRVIVQRGAGTGASHSDEAYVASGAELVGVDEVWCEAELVCKVKDPVAEEWPRMRAGQTLFTYLHLSANPRLTDALLESGVASIAYETVQLDGGALPLLAPMSEIAGRLAPQLIAQLLLTPDHGAGKLFGGATGVVPLKVTIIGAGTVGWSASAVSVGLGATVRLLDRSVARLRALEPFVRGRVELITATRDSVSEAVLDADLVIGAVLVPGAHAPRVLTRSKLRELGPGTILCDVAIDQGGCFETSRPTTHTQPTFAVDGIVHHCVANLPGVAPATASAALSNATLPYVTALSDLGFDEAVRRDSALARGVATVRGQLVSRPVADEQGHAFSALPDLVQGAGV